MDTKITKIRDTYDSGYKILRKLQEKDIVIDYKSSNNKINIYGHKINVSQIKNQMLENVNRIYK